MSTELTEYNKPVTMEIMLRQGPCYIELYPQTNNRFTIKEDSDYVKASYALQRWVEENIVNVDKFDHGEAQKIKRLKQRHMNFHNGQYKGGPSPIIINQINMDDSYSLNGDPGASSERELTKTHELIGITKHQKKINSMYKNNFSTTDIYNNPRKRPHSSASIERTTVVQDTSPKRLKFFCPTKKYSGAHFLTEKKKAINRSMNRSMIIPSTEDVKERINATKNFINKRNPGDPTFIRSITPIARPRTDHRDHIFAATHKIHNVKITAEKKNDQGAYAYEVITKNFDNVDPKTSKQKIEHSNQYGDFGDRPNLSNKPYVDERDKTLYTEDSETPNMTESVHFLKFGRSDVPYEGYKIHPDPPILPYPRSNFLFTCDWDGVIKQFSVADLSLFKQFHCSIKKGARKMVTTRDSRHIIIADLDGYLSHFTLELDGDLKSRGFTREHDTAIRAMALTHDDQFIFTGSHDGILKQHYIHPQGSCLLLRKNWSEVFVNPSSILTLLVTYDNEYLFMGDRDGNLRQFSIRYCTLVKKYSFCGNNGSINALSLTTDNKYLFIGYRNGFLRQVNIAKQVVEKDYGWVDRGGVRSLFSTICNTYLFVGVGEGCLLQIDIKNRKVKKDYGRVLETNIYAITGTDQYGFVFVVDESGLLKILDVQEELFVKSYGASNKAIYCLSLVNW